MGITLNESGIVIYEYQKDLTSITLTSIGYFRISSTFCGLDSISCSETTCQRYFIWVLKSLHLVSFSFTPAVASFSKCSSGVLEKIIMSSRYIMQEFKYKSLGTIP